MRLLAVLNPLTGLGHAAVMGGILRGLRREAPDAAAVVVSGGPPIPLHFLPSDVDLVQLPALLPTEGLFSEPMPRARGLPRPEVRKVRRHMLWELVKAVRPDVLLVEHYPFGRHAFAKELAPLLDDVASRLSGTRIACSLSVLGGRAPEHRREEAVLDAVRRHFDLLLVHTDPRHERLDEDYPAIAPTLTPRVRYTGYVVPGTAGDRAEVRERLGVGPRQRLLVAHAGGGRDGARLLRLALGALPRLGGVFGARWRLLAVAGPAMADGDVSDLERMAARVRGARLERLRPDLAACVAAADAVVCMAGYATCAELLAARVPAVLVPRESDGEQVRRARRLERLGAARVLLGEVTPGDLARALRDAPPPAEIDVDLGGADASARALLGLAEALGPRSVVGGSP